MAEIGEVGQVAFAPEQLPTELLLELLDGARERRLGDVAFLSGTREIQDACHRQEISHLVHFHSKSPTAADNRLYHRPHAIEPHHSPKLSNHNPNGISAPGDPSLGS